MRKKLYVPILLWLCGAALIAASLVFAASGGYTVWFWILMVGGIVLFLAGVYELYQNLKEPRGEERAPEGPESEREAPEYRKKRAVLSKPEWEFYRLLKDFLSAEHFDIMPETALVTVIEKLTQTGYRNELFRIADFCIADASSTEPLLLVELNDASHNRADRKERDRRVAEICERAGMPLVTFTLEEAADAAFVRKTLKRYL